MATVVNQTLHDVKNYYGTFATASNTKIAINYYSNATYNVSTNIDTEGIRMTVSNSAYTNKPCEIIVEYTLKDTATASVMSLSLDEGGEE